MARFVVIEEMHVTMRVPGDLSDELADQVKKILGSKSFRSRLLNVVKQVVAGFPSLTGVRVQISR